MILSYSVQLNSPLGFAVERQHVTMNVPNEEYANEYLDLIAQKGTILEVRLV